MNLAALRKEYRELIDADAKFWADTDGSDVKELSAEQVTAVKDRNKRIEEIEQQIVEAQELEEGRKANEIRRRNDQTPVNALPTAGIAPQSKADGTPGEVFVNDPEFKQWLSRIAPTGVPTRTAFGNSPSVQMKTLVTGASSTQAGALFISDFLGLRDPEGTFMRPLTIVDLITTAQTTSDAVDYVIMGTPTNNAATVAEATASSGSSGTKPESALAFSTGTASIKTLAHYIPVTRRALGDAGQIQAFINSFLRYGLMEELEDQVMSGDGSGENFTGIANVSGTQSQAFDTDLLTTARKARTLVRLNGRAVPSAYVMHPTDWQSFDLLQDNEARYFFGGPSVIGNPRLWGLPVVESEAATVGTGYVADWKWAVLWMREAINILMTDSHSDWFVRNIVAILAEMRAGFGIIRPSAFVEIDLTP